jgi:hypothetical protein
MYRWWIKKRILLSWIVILLASGVSVDSHAFEYESLGRRDPFVPLIGVSESSSVSGARGILTIEDVSLQGIVMGPNGKRAVIVNGELMQEGQRVERLLIESISDNVVMIKIDEERFYLKLYE